MKFDNKKNVKIVYISLSFIAKIFIKMKNFNRNDEIVIKIK